MKRLIILVLILFVCTGVLTRSQNTPPPFVGMGDSLGEGVQSADANNRTQPFGYLNLVGHQMSVPFTLPLIQTSPRGENHQPVAHPAASSQRTGGRGRSMR